MDAIGHFIAMFAYYLTAPLRWLSYLPTWFVSTPQKLLGISLPVRIGCLAWFLLFGCTITAATIILWNDERAEYANYIFTWQFGLAVLLSFIIPFVVYYWLRLWLEGDVSRYPDIDAAWEQGLNELSQQGLDLNSLPVFLVTGAPDEITAHAVFAASFMEFRVQDIPHGRSPLRWYGDDKGIYLVCVDTSQLSKLNSVGHQMARGGESSAEMKQTIQPAQGGGVRGTMVAGGGGGSPPAEGGGDVRTTMAAPTPDVADDSGMLRGTLVPSAGVRGTMTPNAAGRAQPTPTGGALSKRAEEDQRERLRYVCDLLRQARAPVCPINGVLVLLPFDNLQNVMVAKDMPAAIKADLETIRDGTKLRSPVTAMVTGMDHESGFCELVRRVGSRAKDYRFGKGYEVGNPPSAENLDAFTSHACGAFEDWVYSLFRERDGLTKPGNSRLYVLLCKIRGQVVDRLKSVLIHGFGFDPTDKRGLGEPLLFSGCYFAATGGGDGQKAFVKNVFEKMLDLEEELEWTETALAEDERYHNLARIGMVVNGALGLVLLAMFVVYFVWGRSS